MCVLNNIGWNLCKSLQTENVHVCLGIVDLIHVIEPAFSSAKQVICDLWIVFDVTNLYLLQSPNEKQFNLGTILIL